MLRNYYDVYMVCKLLYWYFV